VEAELTEPLDHLGNYNTSIDFLDFLYVRKPLTRPSIGIIFSLLLNVDEGFAELSQHGVSMAPIILAHYSILLYGLMTCRGP